MSKTLHRIKAILILLLPLLGISFTYFTTTNDGEIIGIFYTIVTTIYAWWKNNNITSIAIELSNQIKQVIRKEELEATMASTNDTNVTTTT